MADIEFDRKAVAAYCAAEKTLQTLETYDPNSPLLGTKDDPAGLLRHQVFAGMKQPASTRHQAGSSKTDIMAADGTLIGAVSTDPTGDTIVSIDDGMGKERYRQSTQRDGQLHSIEIFDSTGTQQYERINYKGQMRNDGKRVDHTDNYAVTRTTETTFTTSPGQSRPEVEVKRAQDPAAYTPAEQALRVLFGIW